MPIKHAFTSQKPDSAEATRVQPQRDWNSDHTITGFLGRLDALAVTPNAVPYIAADGTGALAPSTPAGRDLLNIVSLAALLSALGAAPVESPLFAGAPRSLTPDFGDNSTRLATTQFVQIALAALVGSSPAVLDTLQELAAALGNDPNFATSVATALGNRLRIDEAQGLSPAQQEIGRLNLGISNIYDVDLLNFGAAGLSIAKAESAGDVLQILNVADLPWYAIPVGGYFPVDTNEPGAAIPPQMHTDLVYVELTAGLTGSGQFNEGKLTSESVSGSAPLTVATAVVDVATSPMYGHTVPLLNTEEAILRPRAVSIGSLQQDQAQQIVGEATSFVRWSQSASGALSGTIAAGKTRDFQTGAAISYQDTIKFDNANSPGARVGAENRPKNRAIKLFRRLQ